MKMQDAQALPALTLAYIGDGVFEMAVRCYLLEKGYRKPDDLHKKAIEYVKAPFQSGFYHMLEPHLSEGEEGILKRGRNSKSGRQPKHADVQEYRKATAIETLFGALYLGGEEERLNEMIQLLYQFIEKEERAEEYHDYR